MFKIAFKNGTVAIPYEFENWQIVIDAIAKVMPTNEHTTTDFLRELSSDFALFGQWYWNNEKPDKLCLVEKKVNKNPEQNL